MKESPQMIQQRMLMQSGQFRQEINHQGAEILKSLCAVGAQPAPLLNYWERFLWWVAMTFRARWMAQYLSLVLLLSISAFVGCSKPKDNPTPDAAYLAYEYLPSGAVCSIDGKELFHIAKSEKDEPYPYQLRMDVGYTKDWRMDFKTFAEAKEHALKFHPECAGGK